jgi:hypothetical protein
LTPLGVGAQKGGCCSLSKIPSGGTSSFRATNPGQRTTSPLISRSLSLSCMFCHTFILKVMKKRGMSTPLILHDFQFEDPVYSIRDDEVTTLWTAVRSATKQEFLQLLELMGPKEKFSIFQPSAEEQARATLDIRQALKMTKSDGATLLHYAARAKNVEVCEILIDHGCSLQSVTNSGYTPLHYAALCGSLECVKCLLTASPRLSSRAVTNDGRSALHLACSLGHAEIVTELIANGAAVNQQDMDGHTALHFACIDGSPECVQRLLGARAEMKHVDTWGKTALDVAMAGNHTQIVELLMRSMPASQRRKEKAKQQPRQASVGPSGKEGIDGAATTVDHTIHKHSGSVTFESVPEQLRSSPVLCLQ